MKRQVRSLGIELSTFVVQNALHSSVSFFSNAECLVIKLNAVPRILEVMAHFFADDEVVKWACMLATQPLF